MLTIVDALLLLLTLLLDLLGRFIRLCLSRRYDVVLRFLPRISIRIIRGLTKPNHALRLLTRCASYSRF